jgi:hypothetical protein
MLRGLHCRQVLDREVWTMKDAKEHLGGMVKMHQAGDWACDASSGQLQSFANEGHQQQFMEANACSSRATGTLRGNGVGSCTPQACLGKT